LFVETAECGVDVIVGRCGCRERVAPTATATSIGRATAATCVSRLFGYLDHLFLLVIGGHCRKVLKGTHLLLLLDTHILQFVGCYLIRFDACTSRIGKLCVKTNILLFGLHLLLGWLEDEIHGNVEQNSLSGVYKPLLDLLLSFQSICIVT